MSAAQEESLACAAEALNGIGQDPMLDWTDEAAAVLDALKVNGFAVVKLPEPAYRRNGQPVWTVNLDGEPEDVYLGDKGGIVLSGIETFEESDVPDLAAALLAAAAAVADRNGGKS